MHLNSLAKSNNIFILIRLIKFTYNISNNRTDKIAELIKSIFISINYYPISISFMKLIWFSGSIKTHLRKLNPKENISLFSGLNYPIPDLLKIYNNSGDI